MKRTCKSLTTLLVLIGSAGLASATQVTFQVNMSSQTGLGNFNPATDSVVVAGDPLNGWSPSASPLAPSSADTNIWVGTFDITAASGSAVQYKYVMNTSASGVVWEGAVGPGGGTGNRTFTLQASSQTLPVVYFNNVTNSTGVTNAITFQVDMSLQTALGNFDPASGTVTLAGEFNAWSATANPLTNSATDTNIWLTTLSLAGANGATISYKYVMNGTWENNNVGPGGSQNRTMTLARTNQVLPPVFFNNLTNNPAPIPLTFQVDMVVQAALGNFDPATDYVEVRGTFNNWNSGFSLTNSPDNVYRFSGSWVDNDSVGNTVQYKFVLNNASGIVWEGMAANRNYTLTSTNEQMVPLAFFNDVQNLGAITVQSTAAKQITLNWNPGTFIRLQSAGILGGSSWQDVPNTQGSNSVTLPMVSGQTYFRLIGP